MSAPLLPRMVSLPVPPSTVTLIRAARLPVALKLSSPPFMLTTSFSVVPMSRLNGAGLSRSKRTRVPLAVAVKTSAPLPPLTSAVSVPAPPSNQVGVVARVPDHAVVAAFAEHLVVAVAAGQRVVAGAAEQEVDAALAEQGVVAAPGRTAWSPPEPPVSVSLPAPPNMLAAAARRCSRRA